MAGAFIINQEAFLDSYASRLNVNRDDLGDERITLALALYHGVYLPTAALVELRTNELDIEARYAEFGFQPNLITTATADLEVTVDAAPVSSQYFLAAPFVVTQGDLKFLATQDLVIPAGRATATVTIKAQLQGAAGTPTEGTARIATSVGWLRGASIRIDNITPGTDGDDLQAVQGAFRSYVANPTALVRAVDHADWVADNVEGVARAIAEARLEVTYDGTAWTKGGTTGHLTVAMIMTDGALPTAEELANAKADLLLETIPYGAQALHVVPIDLVDVTGAVTVKLREGADPDTVKNAVVDAINAHLGWDSWEHGRHVYAGDMWNVVNAASGVQFTKAISVNGELLDGTPSSSVLELEAWQLPEGKFTTAMITTEA